MASWRPRQGHLRWRASSFRSFLGIIDYGDRGRLVLPVSQVDSCSNAHVAASLAFRDLTRIRCLRSVFHC